MCKQLEWSLARLHVKRNVEQMWLDNFPMFAWVILWIYLHCDHQTPIPPSKLFQHPMPWWTQHIHPYSEAWKYKHHLIAHKTHCHWLTLNLRLNRPIHKSDILSTAKCCPSKQPTPSNVPISKWPQCGIEPHTWLNAHGYILFLPTSWGPKEFELVNDGLSCSFGWRSKSSNLSSILSDT